MEGSDHPAVLASFAFSRNGEFGTWAPEGGDPGEPKVEILGSPKV